jgi:hypothetical protein
MTLLKLSEPDRKLYTKLYASADDLRLARQWAEHIQKKRYFLKPWARGKVYLRQSAYVTALVVAYGRVFASGRGGYKFPKRLMPYRDAEWNLHQRLLDLRHKVHAHSDLDKWNVRPWTVDGFSTAIVGQPTHLIEEADLALFVSMTEKLLEAIAKRKDEILAPYIVGKPPHPSKAVDLAMGAITALAPGDKLIIGFNPDGSVEGV